MPDQVFPGVQNNADATAGTTVVSASAISFDSNDGKFTEEIDPSFVHLYYKIVNRYEKNNGVYMAGLTAPNGFNGASVGFVQIHAPTLLWICDWTAMQANQVPKIPSTVPFSSDWIYLNGWYDLPDVKPAADGTSPIYSITGTYFYGHKNPSSVDVNNLNFPICPWVEDSFPTGRTVSQGFLTPGLIDVPNMQTAPSVPKSKLRPAD